jgi:hypothetical protein
MPLITSPSGGIITSLTSDVTILLNSVPMMMPTARFTTLPFTANCLNFCKNPVRKKPILDKGN